jgi:hypothetical protein
MQILGPLGIYTLMLGSRSEDFFTFIQIGSGHTVTKEFEQQALPSLK